MTPENTTATPGTDFTISRILSAPRILVYKAWTEPERMAQWSTFGDSSLSFNSFDLRPGGLLHSVMRSPDGGEMWGRSIFEEIVPGEHVSYIQSFSDADGGITRHPLSETWPLRMHTTLSFEDAGGGRTSLTIRWRPVDANEAEQQTFDTSHDGMRQGWEGMLDNLSAYLAKVES
jgi:uncharacterized protein YndB with AHSA1/START domain